MVSDSSLLITYYKCIRKHRIFAKFLDSCAQQRMNFKNAGNFLVTYNSLLISQGMNDYTASNNRIHIFFCYTFSGPGWENSLKQWMTVVQG